jgi:hypothetical protein
MRAMFCRICGHSKNEHYAVGCFECFMYNCFLPDEKEAFRIKNRNHQFKLDNLKYLEQIYESKHN